MIVMVSLPVSLAFPPLQPLHRSHHLLALSPQLKLLRLRLGLFGLFLRKESVAFEVHLMTPTPGQPHLLVVV